MTTKQTAVKQKPESLHKDPVESKEAQRAKDLRDAIRNDMHYTRGAKTIEPKLWEERYV